MIFWMLLACSGPMESALWRMESSFGALILSSETITCADFSLDEPLEDLPGDKIGAFFSMIPPYGGDYYLGLYGYGGDDNNGGDFDHSFSAWVQTEGEDAVAATWGVITITELRSAGVAGVGHTDLFDLDFRAENCDTADSDSDPRCDAEEVCDGVDNNCDGRIDEGVTQSYYRDGDGDGYGSQDEDVGCGGEDDLVANSSDCHDDDPAIHPGAMEACDGLDNDCDGMVDEEPC